MLFCLKLSNLWHSEVDFHAMILVQQICHWNNQRVSTAVVINFITLVNIVFLQNIMLRPTILSCFFFLQLDLMVHVYTCSVLNNLRGSARNWKLFWGRERRNGFMVLCMKLSWFITWMRRWDGSAWFYGPTQTLFQTLPKSKLSKSTVLHCIAAAVLDGQVYT